MANATVLEVRGLVGLMPVYEKKEAVKMYPYTADGTNKVFNVPNNYMVDYDGDGDVDTSDVVVYDDGTAVAVTSIDVATGAVTLTNAPTVSSVMTCCYAYSPVKDATISAIIDRVDTEIYAWCRTHTTSTSHTQYWNGDGEKTKFYFRYRPVTAITSVTVDESTDYTANEDYYVQPERTVGQWIEFTSAPSEGIQNVVVVYSYGGTNTIISELSKYMAAKQVLTHYIGTTSLPKTAYTGQGAEQGFNSESRRISMLRIFNEEIDRLKSLLGGSQRAAVV